MTSRATTQIHPAVLEQAREATAGLQLAANNTGDAQYRLVYYAVGNCAETHSYKNLLAVDALPNVRLNYIRPHDPTKPFPGAIGRQLFGNPYTDEMFGNYVGVVKHFAIPTGYEITEANRVVLIGPNGKVVREFANSTSANFVSEVARLTGNPQPKRGVGRT